MFTALSGAVAVVLAAWSPAFAAWPQETDASLERSVRRHEISSLVAPRGFDRGAIDLWAQPASDFAEGPGALEDEDRIGCSDWSTIAELVSKWGGAEVIAEARDGALYVEATVEQHESIAALLEALRREMVGAWQIELRVVAGVADLDAPLLLPAAELARREAALIEAGRATLERAGSVV